MDDVSRSLRRVNPDDINPRFNWGRHLPALGTMGVDFEERVDYRRLHKYRIARVRQALENSELGALITFDVNNLRYITSTKIGEWERDKLSRWALLARGGEPILWDFGSAAVHHKLFCPWLEPENMRAGLVGLRGTVHPDFGLMERHAKEIYGLLKEAGVEKMPIGIDIIEPPMMFQLQKLGLKIVDGQQTMLEAREIKSVDEIALLNRAAAMVDGAYDLINEKLRPGVRENDLVAEVNKFLYTHGSDDVEAINAISGERCNPHPHNFTDRMIRPGDQAFFDILQSFMGYRTCYYRTFNDAAFARHFSGMTDDEFETLAKSKPLRDKFLGEMDKTKGFSTDKLKSAEDSIRKTVARMEPALAANDYLLGPTLTLADFCVLPAMIRMEDLGYEFLWKDKPGVRAWLARIRSRPSFKTAFYPGSLLSEQYPGIREEHQTKRAAAFGDAA